jgi:hypothetical protein
MALFIVSKSRLVLQLMKITVKNRSNQPLGHLGSYLKSLLPFAQKRMGFNKPPYIYFDSDEQNSQEVLGKTGYYNPDTSEIVIYIDNRHPKDVLRSLSHELVHHTQNCRGDLNPEIAGGTELGYAQTNPHMRQMESEAFEKGNLCMRDWEDSVKIQLQETNYYHTKGDCPKMATYEQLKEQITESVLEKLKEKLSIGVVKDDELVERKKRNEPRNDRGMPSRLKEEEEIDENEEVVNEEASEEDVVEEVVNEEEDLNEEEEVVKEEEEADSVNESNDTWYQRNLFESLTKRWTK